MRADEFLRKHGLDEQSLKEREHTLQENARERATHPHKPNAGTPHDWEEWEKLRKELGIEDDGDPLRPTRTKPREFLKKQEKPSLWTRLKGLFKKG